MIAPSFGDIFHDNAFQNGLLPLKAPMPDIERIAQALATSNTSEMTVDLESRVLEVPGPASIPFDLPEERRLRLLEGVDQLGFIPRSEAAIMAFEQQDTTLRPWAYPS